MVTFGLGINIFVHAERKLSMCDMFRFYNFENNKCEVICIDELKELAIIRQQIALNGRMFEADRIPKHLHDRTYKILIDRLTKAATCDTIINNK